jgi:hypothetical protein
VAGMASSLENYNFLAQAAQAFCPIIPGERPTAA